ncbi:MAG: sensor histidine kinase [Streptosporangiaceae bacterium]
MRGRIVATVLALITVLLTGVAVPLGLLTSAQDSASFRAQAVSTARTLASLAEERINDGSTDPGLTRSLRDLARSGDRAAVYDEAGLRVAGTGTWTLAASHVRAPRSLQADGRLTVTTPIIPDSGTGAIGTVALSRSTGSLDRQVTTLWTLIVVVAAAGLLVAAAVAMAIARWVSAPLTTLAQTARQLGAGSLDSRAPVSAGPVEVQRLAATFNSMAARLESLIHDHRSMLADVSHQVRTPLSALRLRLDLLAQDADAQTAAELACAQEEIARLTRLVSGLLAVARAENMTAIPVAVAIDAVIRDRAAAWRPAADERGVTLTVSCPAPVSAQVRDGHLEQILDNLLANALDVLDAGGMIQVAGSTAGGRARIMVSDDGQGMSLRQQRAAFHRFASGTPGGTGLGLAIVDRLAKANDGTATLSDTPGGGLTVAIDLPATMSRRGVPERFAQARRPPSRKIPRN